jgi:hypothetical protein
VASGPPIKAAMVILKDASSVSVNCGDAVGIGTASARISNFPGGNCTVKATYLGDTYTTSVTIERPREVACSVDGDALKCN